jgi:hypothetical protein
VGGILNPPEISRLVAGLAPVAFNPDPPTTPVVPVTLDPAGVGVRRFGIGSGNPDVAFAVPAMVAVVPCPFAMLRGRGRDDFVRPLRRTDTDYDLGLCNSGREKEDAGNCREDFVHCAISLSY